jgi:hypothetical protein
MSEGAGLDEATLRLEGISDAQARANAAGNGEATIQSIDKSEANVDNQLARIRSKADADAAEAEAEAEAAAAAEEAEAAEIAAEGVEVAEMAEYSDVVWLLLMALL